MTVAARPPAAAEKFRKPSGPVPSHQGSRRYLAWALPLIAALLVLAGPVLAPEGAAAMADTGGGSAPAEGPTFLSLFWFSPVINSILLGLSLLSLALFIYLLLSIHPQGLAPRVFVDEIYRLIDDGQYKEAIDFCRSHHKLFAASVIRRCLDNAEKEPSVLMAMVDNEGKRRADSVWNSLSYLADVANVAPMLGLLGTVLGMIKAFLVVRLDAVAASTEPLAGAIGEAMSTTMFGLSVAILALVFHSVLKSRATRALGEVEQVVHGVADRIKRHGAGHSDSGYGYEGGRRR